MLAALDERQWREALEFADRAQLTLALLDRDLEAPEFVRARLQRDSAGNLVRLGCIEGLYRDVADALASREIPFLALKGLAHCPDFVARPERRLQYDIDLFIPRESVLQARDAVLALGYEPLAAMEGFPTDHLPALIRKTGWEWRGDYFDPEIPIAIELHFRFWNAAVERLSAPDIDAFWLRRERREIAGIAMDALAPPDALAYAALHFLKHVLRGSVRPFHAYEIALLLQARRGDEAFWRRWAAVHSPALRRLQAVVFRFAAEWFGCELSCAAQEAEAELPAAARLWFGEFAAAPIATLFAARKEELWLHLSLLESRRDAVCVLRRRLLPANLPGPVDAIHLPAEKMTVRRRALARVRYAAYVGSRARHHAASLPRLGVSGARWWWKINPLGRQFWNFLAAAVLFNFALFVFVLLYNLRLLELGFREDLLGRVTGASAIGCVAGALPAAVAVRRWGLRGVLLGAIGGISALTAARALVTSAPVLIALAFGNGLLFAAWAVAIGPTIAGAVAERLRPKAFSLFFATMLGVGIAGGWAGGKLPLWIHGKQPALLLAAALCALALWPAAGLKRDRAKIGRSVYPRGPFLIRYLAPFALWNLATGAFNPFFNAYFERLRFPVDRIGLVFSGSQAVQVLAVLAAPWLFRKMGIARGIACMMAATALGLAALAAMPPAAAAAAAYIAYMAFQWMSEPGLNTLLMDRVQERERGGAAGLAYFVAFSAQAVAAFAAGPWLARFGYSAVLCGAAALAVVSAGLFRLLLAAPATNSATAEP